MNNETLCVPRELLSSFPEINFSNYGQDEIEALQAWALEAYDALQAAQPVASEPVAFVDGDEVRRFITWAPDKPAFIHPIGTPLCISPPAPAIPEGYALVPIELTESMEQYVCNCDVRNGTQDGEYPELRACYKAMLAAPQPRTEGSTDE